MKIYLYLNKSIKNKEEVRNFIYLIIKRKGLLQLNQYSNYKHIILKKENSDNELQILVDSFDKKSNTYDFASVFHV